MQHCDKKTELQKEVLHTAMHSTADWAASAIQDKYVVLQLVEIKATGMTRHKL